MERRRAFCATVEPVALFCSVLLASAAGAGAGFCTGLVPGLHVNNLAAVVVAASTPVVAFFAAISGAQDRSSSVLLVACFMVSALISHMFSEAIISTYLGIPSADNVSVLPAHRLAKRGMGRSAVRASAGGSLFGVVAGVTLLVPVCLVLGPPLSLYHSLRSLMGLVVLLLSALLVLSEGIGRAAPFRRIALAVSIFAISGLIGFMVLDTNYFASSMPDFPWMSNDFVDRSSLLLPMFAGLFGAPTILLSLRSCRDEDFQFHGVECEEHDVRIEVGRREIALSSLGGLLVGWIPGMTSGSSATLCSNHAGGESSEDGGAAEAARFIWLYSAISSCGAVLSVGALFTIARARSGIMQAVVFFFGGSTRDLDSIHSLEPALAMVLAMTLSAFLSHHAINTLSGRSLERLQRVLCSDRTALVSLSFVVLLVLFLTGTRGGLLLVICASLGMLPPMLGARRINLMGCLLLPIGLAFISGW